MKISLVFLGLTAASAVYAEVYEGVRSLLPTPLHHAVGLNRIHC